MGFFGRKKEIVIQPTYDVIMQCKCAACPVQADSACAKPKIAARNEMIQNPMKTMEQIMTPGTMKNAEMLRNMSVAQMMTMSREDQKKMSDEMMKNTPQEQWEKMKPNTDDMPGPYCANGVAACKDLDFSKTCICPECQIYKENNLSKAKPTQYFCKDGKAT